MTETVMYAHIGNDWSTKHIAYLSDLKMGGGIENVRVSTTNELAAFMDNHGCLLVMVGDMRFPRHATELDSIRRKLCRIYGWPR